jgi:hypothetical protein
MTSGALLIARNNSEVDYTKQAVYAANRIKKYLNLPVSIITDNAAYLKKSFSNYKTIFDQVIEIKNEKTIQYKKYNDGIYVRKNLEYKNDSRSRAYDLSPYDETILLDTDFIISNADLLNCFNQPHDLMMYKDAVELSGWRDVSEFSKISETGPNFYWATVVFFRKTEKNKIFFNLIQHIQENWYHYKNIYQLPYATFRNDYAFSIAVHVMNGYKSGNFVKSLPGTMYYTLDRDLILEIKDEEFLFLVENNKSSTNYFPVKIKQSNVHIMNKINLNRIIDNES